MTPPPPGPVGQGRMLLARLDSLGDVLLMGPAVRAVADGGNEVTVLASTTGRAAAELLPGVADVLTFDAPWVLLDSRGVEPAAVEALVDVVRDRDFAGALLFTSYHQSPLPLALVLRLAGVGWIGAASEDYAGALLDLRLPPAGAIPEVERNLRLVAAAGFSVTNQHRRLAVRRPLPQPPAAVGSEPYVVVHPGTAVAARRPSPAHSRAIVAALVDAGRRVIVTGGADETALTAYVAADRAVDLGGRVDLLGLAAVLARAQVVVAPNTGPAHLAAAVGTPVVSLFAPVVPAARWAPYGVPTILLGDQEAACRDTRARQCPVPGHPCLSSIRPADVVAAVAALARPGTPKPTKEVRHDLDQQDRRGSEVANGRRPSGRPRPRRDPAGRHSTAGADLG